MQLALGMHAGHSPTVDDLPDDLAVVQEQLRDKEQLVAALTERLEQAAEQLDRLKRTGADRGPRSAAGFPAELVDEQKQLVGDLQHAVDQWEEMQSALVLQRLEERLDLIYQLVAEGHPEDVPNAAPHRAAALGDRVSNHTAPNHWESLKEELLSSGARQRELPHDADLQDPHDSSEAGSQQSALTGEQREELPTPHSPLPTPEDLQPFGAIDPPEPVDFAAADSVALYTAIECRDEYIAYLLKQLRGARSVVVPPADWAALNNAPDALRKRLELLEKQLEEKLRVAEVELSLERARLGREAVKLRQLEEQVQKNMCLLGLNPNSAPSNHPQPSAASAAAGEPGNRWLKMLGLGHASGGRQPTGGNELK